MKRVIIIVIAAIFVFAGGIFIKNNYMNRYSINLKDDKINYTIKYKGIMNGRDLAVDCMGNYYIAYKDRIQIIDEKGKSYEILKDEKLNINSIEFFDNKLFFTSNCSIYSFDLKDKSLVTIRDDLPNFGDYKDSVIRVYGENLYISIGAATNSGVVGPDNKWLKTNTYSYDITPFDISVKGLTFGKENTGAFIPYKTRNLSGQIVPGHVPGNASIIKVNYKSGNVENYAWGIRNVKGMDFDSKGKLYASIGGMENRGLRPIKFDFDYIFRIDRGLWYGWPDYSGGDPVNSPRFNKNYFILDQHPSVNPPAPLYQHTYLNALGALAIDKNGDIGEKDSIYFYDNKTKNISEVGNEGKVFEKIQLSNKSDISSIKFGKSSLIILDSKQGFIIQVSKVIEGSPNKYYRKIFYILIAIILLVILYIIKTLLNKNTK